MAAVARSELREHWRRLLATGLVVGLAGAVVFGSAALAQRTSTAYQRLAEATRFEDLNSIGLDAAAIEQVRGLPGVRELRNSPAFVAQLDAPGQVYLSMTTLPADPWALGRPLVIDGRDLDPGRVDEALVAEPLAEQLGLRAGDSIGLTLLSRDEYAQFAVGFGEPDGPALAVSIVGIVRYPIWGQASPGILVASALGEELAVDSIGAQTLVAFDGGVDRQALADQITAIADAVPIDPAFAPTVTLQPTEPVAAVAVGRRVTVAALVAFVAVAAAAAIVVAAQSVGRQVGAARSDQLVEAALGLRGYERSAARAALYLPAAALAASIAGFGVVLAGMLEPIGALGGYEPSPGWRIAWPIVGWAMAATVLLLPVTAAVCVLAPRGTGRRPAAPRRRIATGLARGPVGLVAAASVGGDGTGPSRRWAGADLVTLAVAVAAVCSIAVVHASSMRAESQPSLWGWQADFAVEDVRPEQLAALAADPQVAAVQALSGGTVIVQRPDGTPWAVSSFGAGPAMGPALLVPLSGRLPAADDDVALGPAVARELALDVGGDLRIRQPDGSVRTLVVVGIVAIPPLYNNPLGESLITTPALMAAVNATIAGRTALVQAAPGAEREVLERWRQQAEVLEPYRPAAVSALAELGALPWLVHALFATVAVVALVRGRALGAGRGQQRLDTLRAIGMTPRQAALSELASVGVLAVGAALIGVPLGLALGRLLWTEIAGSLGLPVELAGLVIAPVLVLVGLAALAAAVGLPAAAQVRRRAAGTPALRPPVD